jgi:integrase/recombinase XerD
MTSYAIGMHPEDFLTLEEWHRLLVEAPTPRDAALLWLMAGCGLRVSEVAALKVDHLDGPGGYLHVVDGKSGKQRTSILPKPVLEALKGRLNGREDRIVFGGRDHGHISTRQIQMLLDAVADREGFQQTRPGNVRKRKRVTPHLLKHRFWWSLDAEIDARAEIIAYLPKNYVKRSQL